jgi:hypothetical protein
VITVKERQRAASRVLVAGLVGALVGGAVALVFGRISDGLIAGAWQVIHGTLAFLAAFGITLALLGGRVQRRAGYLMVALAAGLLSAGTWFIIILWGIPLLNWSGAWLWPLAVCSAVAAVVAALRPAGDRARSDRQRPPAVTGPAAAADAGAWRRSAAGRAARPRCYGRKGSSLGAPSGLAGETYVAAPPNRRSATLRDSVGPAAVARVTQ